MAKKKRDQMNGDTDDALESTQSFESTTQSMALSDMETTKAAKGKKSSAHAASAKKHAKKDDTITISMPKNPWMVATVVLTLIVIYLIGFSGKSMAGGGIGEAAAGEIVLDFASSQGLEATLVGVEEENGLYRVDVEVQGQQVPVYVTTDGEALVPSVVPIATLNAQAAQGAQGGAQPTPTAVPQAERPNVELFVMTHCPYGTQAEKGFVPVMRILESKDLADVNVRFVHYFLHEPENDETPIQVCIREEQNDKFIAYLEEFLNEGNTQAAMQAAGVDATAVQECIDSGRAAEYYAEDSRLSQQYGVQGSPTLVINGVQSNAGRSEAAYLTGICSAFSNAPDICGTLELESANPAPGFGWEGSSTAALAAC